MREKSHSRETWTFSRLVFTCFSQIPAWWIWGKHSQYPGFQKACQKRSHGLLHSQLGKEGCPIELEGAAGRLCLGSRGSSGEQGHDHSGDSERTEARGRPGEGLGRRGPGMVWRAGLKGAGKQEWKRWRWGDGGDLGRECGSWKE